MIPVNEAIYQGKLDNFCAAYAVLNGLKLITHMNNMQARVMLNEMFYHESQDRLNWLHVIGHETDYNELVTRMLKRWESAFHYTSFCPFVPHNYEKNIFQSVQEAFNQENLNKKTLSPNKLNPKESSPKESIINELKNSQKKQDEQQTSPEHILETFRQKPIRNFLERVHALFAGKHFDMDKAFETPEVNIDTIWSTLKKHVVHGKSTAIIRFCRFLPGKAGPIVDHWTTVREVTDHAIYFFDCSLEESGWYVIPREKLHAAPFASIPPQALALKEGYKLSLAEEEFAVICPENIHIVSMEQSPFAR